jgi:polyphosphate kinase 2 (PPK2 family)
MSPEEYRRELDQWQEAVFELEHQIYVARVPVVIVYEGWDAAGKGGNIRRLGQGLDPRGYEVGPIGAPTEEEKAHHYLWRFWRQIPKGGHITIFDRSWYGRVMVERIEGFCTQEEWQRAYQEINEFEHQLAAFGTAIVKFWLHMSPEEQLRRFEQRQATEYKQWKLTDEDWRNREKWDAYALAVGEMIERTSTPQAPWTIIAADCKRCARINSIRTVAEAMRAAVEHSGVELGGGKKRRRGK